MGDLEGPVQLSAAAVVESLARHLEPATAELTFEAVVGGRDAAVAIDGAGRRLVVVAVDGSETSFDLSTGGTIQRLHQRGTIEIRIESGGQHLALFDLVDWATAGMVIDVLRLRGFRSESPSTPPPSHTRHPRLLATRRRGATASA